MSRMHDMTGERHGRLTVIKYDHSDKYYKAYWLCKCDCGNYTVVDRSHLLTDTKSCGCLQREIASKIGRSFRGAKRINGKWVK